MRRAAQRGAYGHEIPLDFIRPDKPMENAFIESFHGRLRNCEKRPLLRESIMGLSLWVITQPFSTHFSMNFSTYK
jgi:transposase InsO family protein